MYLEVCYVMLQHISKTQNLIRKISYAREFDGPIIYASTDQQWIVFSLLITSHESMWTILVFNYVRWFNYTHWFISTCCSEYAYSVDIKLIPFQIQICLIQVTQIEAERTQYNLLVFVDNSYILWLVSLCWVMKSRNQKHLTCCITEYTYINGPYNNFSHDLCCVF